MNLQDILLALEARTIDPLEARKRIGELKNSLASSEAPVNELTAESEKKYMQEKVAIIGMSGRYPDAEDLSIYWDNLYEGKNSVKEISNVRWDVKQYGSQNSADKVRMYAKWLGALDDIDCFDPLFFQITPLEAELMDPQQRIFLQEGYRAFEDAGYSREALANKNCGVYLGIMHNEYGVMQEKLALANGQSGGGFASSTGNSAAIAAARLSYLLNLKGPAIPVDTACSSSLVSIHLAIQALLNHEIDMALAGGVTLYLTPQSYISMCDAGMLSADGKCKAFDNRADGFVPGEGAGALVLKRLSDAEADGDHIYGVILGSGINQDGRTNGITAPSANSQMELVRSIYDKYQIEPGSIGYVEMHGTGTKLGDPIELDALSTVYQETAKQMKYCGIGSVKSNIGHTSAAAGVAGVQKVLLCMKHRHLVPSLHFNEPNEHFQIEQSPFYVNQTTKPWDTADGKPLRAAVSSFGFSGTNAHLVIEEYVPSLVFRTPNKQSNEPVVIVLSARTNEQLQDYARRMVHSLEGCVDDQLSDIAYTLQIGREAMEFRLAFAAVTVQGAIKELQHYLEGNPSEKLQSFRFKKRGQSKDEASKRSSIMHAGRLDGKAAENIAAQWVQGVSIDWSILYGERKPRRISLPTYPFAKERYWLPGIPSQSGEIHHAVRLGKGSTISVSTTVTENHQGRSLRFVSKRFELAPIEGSIRRPSNMPIAIVASEATRGFAQELSRYLPRSEVIEPGGVLEMEQEQENTMKRQPKDFAAVVDVTGCAEEGESYLQIIPWLQDAIEERQKEGIVLLGITQGLEKCGDVKRPVSLAGAASAGLYRMLQSEYSHVISRHVDLDPADDMKTMAKQIGDELQLKSLDIEVSYRGGLRYRAGLEEIRVEERLSGTTQIPLDQVVWITGGTRGVGALCARHLVQQYGIRKLVLTGREQLPARDLWHEYEHQQSETGRKIRHIRDLEGMGAQVLVLSVTLSDEQAVRESMEMVIKTMGPVGGVIHGAGLTDMDSPAFIRKQLEGIRRVMEPKVEGVHTLSKVLQGQPLRFFVLCSSVSSIIPSLGSGQSDYVMANSYMDYAALAHAEQYPMVSVQWPSWKETGFGEVKSRVYYQTGLLSHTNEEGLAMLDIVLNCDVGHVVLPAMVDPEAWQPKHLMDRKMEDQQKKKPVIQPAYEDDERLLRSVIKRLVRLFSSELKIDPRELEPDVSFQEFGVDSILLAQLLRTITQWVGDELDPSILYEYSNMESLAVWLVQTYPSVWSGESDLDIKTSEVGGHSDYVKLREESFSLELPISDTRTSWDDETNGIPVGTDPRDLPSSPNTQMRSIGRNGDVVVVGMSCHFPGAPSLDAYWDLLKEGRSAIERVPQERWGQEADYYAGLIKIPTEQAASRFHIAPEDARVMDPQALLLLEESLKAWQHAGYTIEKIKGAPVSVYIGGRSQHRPDEQDLQAARNPILAVGPNYLAANISHYFDLRGPSIVLDTACSSALVGLHMAIQALHSGEITGALVGGVSLLGTDQAHRLFHQRGILSKEPNFHLFDGRTSGTVLSEGGGVVIIKTLEQAQEDGDRIYAVIKGTAVNNDGRTAGPATPNLQAQQDVMHSALERSGKQATDIRYIEANGSGSLVTDLLELKAIQKVYREESSAEMALGSSKPNIGHPLCAEGIAGLIKVVLMLHYRELAPFLSGQEPMKHFDIAASPFYFTREPTIWKGERPVAAMNCFADGGTNAHVILEAWEPDDPGNERRVPIEQERDDQVRTLPKQRELMVWDLFG